MKTRIILKVIPLVLFAQILFAQSDNIGSGRAINFDGVDDFIDLGNVYDDIKFPITIAAWVNLDQNVFGWAPVFVTQDNSSIYNGFWFIVQSSRISIGYGDGEGENNEVFRRSKIAEVSSIAGRWVHLSAVIRGAVDMDIFVNGINVGGEYSGSSSLPMSSSNVDVAKIGYWYSNQSVFRFKGSIDEVRLWNRSLSQSEVRDMMCKKVVGNPNGLIGLWNFDETNSQLLDQSTSGINGVLHGSPTRQFSGAPIGNESQYIYTSGLTNQNFNFTISPTLKVTEISGNPEGIHVYKVDSPPSIQAGLTVEAERNNYYGVFLASLDSNNKYNIELLNQGSPYCNFFTRISNNSQTWLYLDNPQIDVLQRGEYLIASGIETHFDLDDRIVICQGDVQNIDTGITDENVSILWSTGATTPNIIVNTSGTYSVEVTGACGTKFDQIEIVVSSPPLIELGNKVKICLGETYVIDSGIIDENVSFLWNTGATSPKIEVNTSGMYSVAISGPCGLETDQVEIIVISPPVFDFGDQIVICEGETQNIDTGIIDDDATFLWNTGSTSRNIFVTTPGIYSVDVNGVCGSFNEQVEVVVLSTPPRFSFGDDIVLCTIQPFSLRPFDDTDNYLYKWQDGSESASFQVSDFGTYWVEVSNKCGSSTDTVKYSKLNYRFENIPNVITPNGDNDNEFFVVSQDPGIQPSILIIDRWGIPIYENHSYKNDWNANGVSTGVYFYRLTGPCLLEAKGSINVLR